MRQMRRHASHERERPGSGILSGVEGGRRALGGVAPFGVDRQAAWSNNVRKRFGWLIGGAAGAVAGVALYAHRVARARVSLDRFTVPIDKPGVPQEGIAILHLSDFHFRAVDPVQETRLARLRTLLAGEQYDIVAVTGDLIHNRAGLPRALVFLAELHPSLGVFSVPGNRDYWESSLRAVFGTPDERRGLSMSGQLRLALRGLRRMLRMFAGNERATLKLRSNDVPAMHEAFRSQGIEPLVNKAVNIVRPGCDLWLAGVDDLTQGRPDLAAALASVPQDASVVLLAHNPDVWLDERTRRVDLILSGHTHGGQLRFPLLGAWYRQGTHLSRRKAAGWFEDDGRRMYVSRGLGESFPFRLGAQPQAALIRLVRA
jgi:predicted MPP superfamily phosphohydrolase